MKTRKPCSPASRSRGMSLIEILVGLAIALIGMLIMFQVFISSGERGRTTTSGSDAQIAGTLALFQLERDVKAAGMGFGKMPARLTAGGVAGCAVQAYNSAMTAPAFTFPLAAVQITKGALGAPDEIAVFYGNSAYFVTSRQFSASTATSKSLIRRDAFNPGDRVLVTDNGTTSAGNCALVEITANTNADTFTVDHQQVASYASFPNGTMVPSTMNAAAAQVAATGLAYNLGPEPSLNIWRVTPAGAANPNMLVWRNRLGTDVDAQVTEGIVNLQAEYGIDDGGGAVGAANGALANDGIISPDEWTTAPPATVDWTRLLAVRFAVLARSQQYEKAAVTTVAPRWAGESKAFTMFNVNGSTDSSPGDANDWRHYRYRVYESIVPLRNLIW